MLNALRASVVFLAAMGIAQADLIHSYSFDNGLTDSGTVASNGTLVGDATVSGGKLVLTGGYAQFDSFLVPTGGSYSVSVDFQLASTDNPGITEFISQGFSGGPGFYLGTNGYGFRASDAWGSPAGTYNPATAHTVLLSVDSSVGVSNLYLDGTLVGTQGFAIATTTGGTNTRFGSQFSPYAEHFIGTLDNIRVFNSAITPEQDVDNPSEAPEPGTIFLAGLGVTAAALARRRAAR